MKLDSFLATAQGGGPRQWCRMALGPILAGIAVYTWA